MTASMGYNYIPQRTRNLYDPASDKPFNISRSKIDRFVECPRCFYIDRRLGTGRPDAEAFDARIDFDIRLIPYEGTSAGWRARSSTCTPASIRTR